MKTQQLSSKLLLFDIDYTLFDRDTFVFSNLTTYKLFEEIPSVLNKIAPVVTLGILSQGEDKFQLKKLQETGILHHFPKEKIHITTDKETLLKTVFDNYKTFDAIYLVDDKLTILQIAKKHLPSLTTIWIKRGRYAEQQEPIEGFAADFEMDTLQELFSVITQK